MLSNNYNFKERCASNESRWEYLSDVHYSSCHRIIKMDLHYSYVTNSISIVHVSFM